MKLHFEDNLDYQLDAIDSTVALFRGQEINRTEFTVSKLSHPVGQMNIPGMDGLETTTRFKADPGLTDIPIVALTANAMKGDKERCLAAGCNGYMQKPVGVSDLRREILRYSEAM